MLPREVPQGLAGTVFEEVARGLGPRAERLAEYHRLAHQLATDSKRRTARPARSRAARPREPTAAGRCTRKSRRCWSRTSLDADAAVADLSAGVKRRVLLAKALARNPDVLFLDEPTNHLDLAAIAWLEEFLVQRHDSLRHPRPAVTRWRRESSKSTAAGYRVGRATTRPICSGKRRCLVAEARQQAEFDKKLAREEVWIRTGIQARRTRNEGGSGPGKVGQLRGAAAICRARGGCRFKRRSGRGGG